ncbi:MAG TPA: hypothetical protein V6D47_04430 [Oscillatoriaceae cyanobacterium]
MPGVQKVRTHAAPGKLTITHTCALDELASAIECAGYEAARLPEPWWTRWLARSD